jgi:type I restriction enzyme M protein
MLFMKPLEDGANMSLSTTIKTIQDIMRKDAGIDGDAQRIGQLGWMLFYKIYSDLEVETELEDVGYYSPVPSELRWGAWADDETLGAAAPTGADLLDLVDNSLFPALKDLEVTQFTGKARQRAELLRAVFEDAYNYMKSGTLMRQVINRINHDVDFNESKTRHTFGDIYEQILKDLQSAGNAGEFYTPRAATQFAVDMVNPQFGESVLDPACGTGGFLTCAYEKMRPHADTLAKLTALKASIFGVEKKALPHLLCVTNLMVHGIEVPTGIRHGNTLARPLRDYGPKDQVDVIVTNPPFGGMEEDGIENNFPNEFRTRETADLFLVLAMELLKDGGRAAIILPDGTLFGEGIKTRIKKKLLEECNLHTIIRLPKGVFAPYTTIKTNILFFTKGEPTKDIWFYEHPYPDGYRSYSKTKPIGIAEFDPEKAWWPNRKETERAWKVTFNDIAAIGYNLDFANPNIVDDAHEDPDLLLARYAKARSEVDSAREALMITLANALGRE